MKSQFFSCLLLLSSISVFSQPAMQKQFRNEFKQMAYVSSGSFNMKNATAGGETANVILSAFYVSQEVTNKEYREFIADIKLHPTKKLVKKIYPDSTLIINYSEIEKDILDSAKFPYQDYFSNKKYDNFPVTGVSTKHADYYTLWKSVKEWEFYKHSVKPVSRHKGASMPLRIPSEAQMAYVKYKSLQPLSKERKELNIAGKENVKGFYMVKQEPQVLKVM
ncbi:MAG: SUMF1/EgtB/PvdO family nonheme iron enzyme [Sphingobacteriaceae bacterium]|nr:SUMF1/EgtB/PvdO family nonheme iron enzyme [Sphingobacteriaceae bacterium]